MPVFRGETQLLEVMLQKEMLNRFYMEGRRFRYLSKSIARVARQIAPKRPSVKVLEIGAGTGGTTKSLLDKVENPYLTYTYTDVSTGVLKNRLKG